MGELTSKYRPKRFSEVIGQPLAVKMLKAVSKNPGKSPRVLVLSGGWGCGKTTSVRILSRALNCERFHETGDVCLKCPSCMQWSTSSNKYIEYDSSMVGNVNQIRELRPIFEQYTDYFRVICLDEAHLITRQAQSALLKVMEEGPKNTFFVLCSTDPAMILDTIHSRSAPVDFFKVADSVIKEHVKGIYKVETGNDLIQDIQDKLAFKSDGHVRDAVMLLESYIVSNDESIFDLPLDPLMEFFYHMGVSDKTNAVVCLRQKILRFPTYQIHSSLNFVVMQLLASYSLKQENRYYSVANLYKDRLFDVFKTISESHVQGIFNDKYLTTAFFLTMLRQFSR